MYFTLVLLHVSWLITCCNLLMPVTKLTNNFLASQLSLFGYFCVSMTCRRYVPSSILVVKRWAFDLGTSLGSWKYFFIFPKAIQFTLLFCSITGPASWPLAVSFQDLCTATWALRIICPTAYYSLIVFTYLVFPVWLGQVKLSWAIVDLISETQQWPRVWCCVLTGASVAVPCVGLVHCLGAMSLLFQYFDNSSNIISFLCNLRYFILCTEKY